MILDSGDLGLLSNLRSTNHRVLDPFYGGIRDKIIKLGYFDSFLSQKPTHFDPKPQTDDHFQLRSEKSQTLAESDRQSGVLDQNESVFGWKHHFWRFF